MKDKFKSEIDKAKVETDNKFDSQTEWDLLPQLIISIDKE